MVVQRLDMTVCRHHPPENSAAVTSLEAVPDRRLSTGRGSLCTRKSNL